ncbi:hypothetical protein BS47DRAFT_1340792, partial [Hydnum rufescens UP504]
MCNTLAESSSSAHLISASPAQSKMAGIPTIAIKPPTSLRDPDWNLLVSQEGEDQYTKSELHRLMTMLCTELDLSKIHLTQCQATQESYKTQLILQNL